MHLEVAPLLVWGGHSCPPPLMLIAARPRIAETVTIVSAPSFAAKDGALTIVTVSKGGWPTFTFFVKVGRSHIFDLSR